MSVPKQSLGTRAFVIRSFIRHSFVIRASSLDIPMHWPVQRQPIPPSELPYFNLHYLYGCSTPSDPTMVWGTELDADGLIDFVRQRNETGDVLISPAHVLLHAVGRAMARFPHLNCRVIRRRIHRFRETSVRAITYDARRREVEIVLLKHADTLTLEQIARTLWKNQRKTAKADSLEHHDRRVIRRLPDFVLRWGYRAFVWLERNVRLPSIRLNRLSNAPVVVNYLGFTGAPPMRMYKPSAYPNESSHLSVTMGPIEMRPVVRDGKLAVGRVAPLFVRGDHRLTDAYLLARFVGALRDYLMDPTLMESPAGGPTSAAPEQPAKAA